MRIPILAGEGCREQSNTSEVVVNRSFANLYLNGSSSVIGHELMAVRASYAMNPSQIRGIVGDAREEGLNTQPVPTVYVCASAPNPFPNYLLRTHGEPMTMADAIRRRVHELEPQRSVYAMMPLEQHLDDASSENHLRTMLLALFAATAVSLACIGLYGTLSYLGRLRQREVGVRLALGAIRNQIVVHFLAQGLRVTAVGCVAGLILSLGADRLLSGMLYGVSVLDAKTYIAVLLLVLAVATLSSLLPAWRAASVEPIRVLREE
jgi:putative ABC transport system permease protein